MRLLYITITILLLSACATGATLVTGQVRPAIDAAQVKVYNKAPDHFEEIAVVRASAQSGSMQERQDMAIEELRKRAAAVGANGILIEEIGEEQSGGGGIILSPGYGIGMHITSSGQQVNISAKAIYVAP